MQLWPLFPNNMQAWFTATSISASPQIMFADLPPNSRVIGFRFSLCELRIMMYPTSVDPVNETLFIPLCVEMNDPV